MKRIAPFILFLNLIILSVYAQNDLEAINTGAANFLTITPDARTAGMGGVGVALTGNDNTVFYNGASSLSDKYRKGGITYNLTPWMREHKSGYSFHSLGGFYKINQKNAIIGGLRYLNYPEVETTGNNKNIHPKEWAVDIGYAREVFKDFALSATFKYIRSDMGDIGEAKSSGAVAFDIGALYKREIPVMQDAFWTVGLQLSNVGSKIKYLDTKESLPSMVKLGGSINLPFNPTHKLIFTTDMGYRLAPSDAQSFNLSLGAEYILIDHFKFRGGYHYGDDKKGDASYGTLGLGINYYGAHLDFSWLFANNDNMLRNTFWTSVGFSF